MAIQRGLLKTVLLASLCCAASVAAYHWTPSKMLADLKPPLSLKDQVPESFGEWRSVPAGSVVVPDPSQLEMINKIYNETLSRTYVNKQGEQVMLSLAYGRDQSERMQVHTPEICYPSQGYKVTPSQETSMTLGEQPHPVVRLVGTQGTRVEPITYWIVMGDHIVNGGPGDRRNVRFIYGFDDVVPDGVFFRMSSIGTDVDKQYALHQRFANDLSAALPKNVADRLIGTKIYQ